MDLSDGIREYIAQRMQAKLEKHDAAATKALDKVGSDEERAALAQSQREKRHALEVAHRPKNWLDDAARRAAQVSLVTHAPKFTHGDSKASGVNARCGWAPPSLLGTHSLASFSVDVVGNAAALDVANLLMLREAETSLWQQIAAEDSQSLRPFSDDEEQLQAWMKGFGAAVGSGEFRAHTLAKQTYFPVGDSEYHLVGALFPSSLAHAMHQRAGFDEQRQAHREQRKKGLGCSDDVVFYLETARQNFGGTKPQNISLLNSRRGGKAWLLSCTPPIWRDQLRLPIKSSNSFWVLLRSRTWRERADLRDFLSRAGDYNNVDIRQGRARRITRHVDALLTLAAEIQRLGEPGWSRSSKLPLAEQCFLDPGRYVLEAQEFGSTAFTDAFDAKSWRLELASTFGLWMNRQLSGIRTSSGQKLRDLGDLEAQTWQKEVETAIAILRNDLEGFL